MPAFPPAGVTLCKSQIENPSVFQLEESVEFT